MTRLQLIRVNPEVPQLQKAHKKHEDVWSNQYDKAEFVEDVLKTYPARNEEILSWNTGVERARKDLISVRICLTETRESPENSWHFYPHGCNKDIEEAMVLEEELEELHETEEADYTINESGNIEDWIEDTQNTLTEILPNETSRDTVSSLSLQSSSLLTIIPNYQMNV